MLNIGNHHGWGVEVELLHCIIGAESEENCAGPIHGEAADVLKRWYTIPSDMFSSHIPR